LITDFSSLNWNRDALRIIPITKYSFKNHGIDEDEKLDHGYSDLSFFPTWKEFITRSNSENLDYPKYMTFLLCKNDSEQIDNKNILKLNKIIGVIAVQLIKYDFLREKFEAAIPDIKNYLYLSWIALDKEHQSNNYFSILFEFYFTLIRRFRKDFNLEIEGAAIIIRRMRPVLWSLFNDNIQCPTNNDKEIIKTSPRFKFIFMPVEIIDNSIELKKDYVVIYFKQRSL
jgi:hypothetical protein